MSDASVTVSSSDLEIKYLDLRTVRVKFAQNPQLYSYFVPDGDAPAVGDVVITSVQMANSTDSDDELEHGSGFIKFAKIIALDSIASSKATKMYLYLLPLDMLRERRVASQTMLSKIAERKELYSRLDTLLLQQSKIEHYRRLAETNPEARELLRQLEAK